MSAQSPELQNQQPQAHEMMGGSHMAGAQQGAGVVAEEPKQNDAMTADPSMSLRGGGLVGDCCAGLCAFECCKGICDCCC